MATKTKKPRIECPNCGRKITYRRLDGTVRCTACGYDSKKGESK